MIISDTLKFAFPSIASLLFVMVMQIINTVFINNIDDPYQLAGIGMGNMTINILGYSFILGLNSAIDTFVSHAYGTGNHYMCGVFLNRGRLLVCLAFIPIILLLLQADYFLIRAGTDKEVTRISYQYIRWLMPGVFFFGQFDCVRRYLNNMGK